MFTPVVQNRNPFNGIERITEAIDRSRATQLLGIHSMELKENFLPTV